MKKSAVGVMNGNSRNREYLQGLQAEKNNPDLCQCGAVKSLPMYLVGKTDLCYDCYLATQELDKVESTYGANWEQDADSLREILQNGNSMVLNQSGVEQADEAETTYLPHMEGNDLVWQGVQFDMKAIGANIKANSAKYQAKIKADQAEAARRHEEGKERARKSLGMGKH